MTSDDQTPSGNFGGIWLVDISASLFCVTFIILAMLIAVYEPIRLPQSKPSSPSRIEQISHDIRGAAVQSASDYIQMLHRRTQITHTSLDIGPLGLLVKLPAHNANSGEYIFSHKTDFKKQLSDVMAATDQPIDVFIFSHNKYHEVINYLRSRNISWREISVPASLQNTIPHRELHPPRDRTWSIGFRELFDKQISSDDFSSALTQLLAGGGSDHRSDISQNAKAFDNNGKNYQMPLLKNLLGALNVFLALSFFLLILSIPRLATRLKAK